ncbi:PREDICTED: probable glycoprotein hormone G-protein coupled receptor [Acropora digitifera]|uniref:probable glycoprotein hormone G-protein coupled receptor n=1 Tax=Acropora digitifera TaxID=70779 RepID=UPI00077A38A4|nr:PREDICTED: probable glycoprotein hormone G-protein coupled receptor [Acropora digitifera]
MEEAGGRRPGFELPHRSKSDYFRRPATMFGSALIALLVVVHTRGSTCPNKCRCVPSQNETNVELICSALTSFPKLDDLPIHTFSLRLDRNRITKIPAKAFSYNKKLSSLSLKYSWLSKLDENAFTGSYLEKLYLQGTSIKSLPSAGLQRLKTLNLEFVKEFWSIPPGLTSIREVHVSKYNSFLCCAFHLGTYQRDHGRQVEKKSRPTSSSVSTKVTENPISVSSRSSTAAPVTMTTTQQQQQHLEQRPPSARCVAGARESGNAETYLRGQAQSLEQSVVVLQTLPKEGYLLSPPEPPQGLAVEEAEVFYPELHIPRLGTTSGFNGGGSLGGGGGGFEPGTYVPSGGSSGGGFIPDGDGFLPVTITVPDRITHHPSPNASVPLVKEPAPDEIVCLPERDAYHPCEDIMGAKWLTIVSLLVGVVALISNLTVAFVLIASERRLNVHRFLMSNLAFADFCLGLYIFTLVCVSLNTSGEYYNSVRTWQYGASCQITGFLAVFSTELSVFTLTLITIERFFAIVYAMEINYRVSLRKAVKVMVVGWLFAFLVALLPLLGVNDYRSVAICLPFDSDSRNASAYIAIVLVLNFGTFLVVAGLYAKMFQVVVGPGPVEGAPQRNDAKVAKRMALLVFTDFVCWTPIAFFGLLAAFGIPLIGVEESKFLLVFFFPLNSLCNPFLYAFFTKAFKREFFSLLSRFGFCHTRAMRYKGTLSSLVYSRTRTKRSTIGEDDSRTKRISQISATSATTGNGSTKENCDENYNGGVFEYIAMKGANNQAFDDTSPHKQGNDDVFFDLTTKEDTTRSESPGNSDECKPQLMLAPSVGSLEEVERQTVEKKSKKLSVCFRDEPQVAGRK